MIIKGLLSLILSLLEILFGWVSFPHMPAPIVTAVDTLMGAIADAVGFIWLIVPRELVIVGIPIILVLENFDKLYSVIMWILKKIPFLGLQ